MFKKPDQNYRRLPILIHQYDIVKAGQAKDACKLPSPEKTDTIVIREPGILGTSEKIIW